MNLSKIHLEFTCRMERLSDSWSRNIHAVSGSFQKHIISAEGTPVPPPDFLCKPLTPHTMLCIVLCKGRYSHGHTDYRMPFFSYYSLATTVAISYVNHLGHNAVTSGYGSGSAGVSISSGTVTNASSTHDVISSAYGNWHATLSVTP